jgi:hypothetical protein
VTVTRRQLNVSRDMAAMLTELYPKGYRLEEKETADGAKSCVVRRELDVWQCERIMDAKRKRLIKRAKRLHARENLNPT